MKLLTSLVTDDETSDSSSDATDGGAAWARAPDPMPREGTGRETQHLNADLPSMTQTAGLPGTLERRRRLLKKGVSEGETIFSVPSNILKD